MNLTDRQCSQGTNATRLLSADNKALEWLKKPNQTTTATTTETNKKQPMNRKKPKTIQQSELLVFENSRRADKL